VYHPPPHNEPQLLELVPRGEVALDIGANVGAWSFELLKRFDHVHAIEPQLECSGDLRALAAVAHDRFTIHQWAAWMNKGELLLHSRQESGTSSICGVDASVSRGPVVLQYAVACQPADFLELPVSFIKIDVEGAEKEVLQGLQVTLSRARPALLVEYHAAENRDWVRAWLKKRGYKSEDRPINDELGWIYASCNDQRLL
jgi:FkbM family methyltransferase